MIIIAAASAGLLGLAIGYFVAAAQGAKNVDRHRQARRLREEEARNLRLQLSGLRRAYQTGTVSVPSSDTESADDRISALLEEVRSMVAPLAQQAERQSALTRLSPELSHRGHLTALLHEIAARAGMSTVVLSDAGGLPIADTTADEDANDCEALAAASAMILMLRERLEDSGQPAIVATVLREAQGRTVLHRVFDVAHERFVLTGVTASIAVAPDALDATLPQLRVILRKPTAAVA